MKTTLSIVFSVLSFIAIVCWAYGVRFNNSSSVEGLFFRTTEYMATNGELVYVCPSRDFVIGAVLDRHASGTGKCGGIPPLLKRLVAVSGDAVLIGDAGVVVNNLMIPNSAPLKLDGNGLPLPIFFFDGIVPVGAVVVLGDHPGSYDSRYFGIIEELWITGQAKRIY